jgi:glycosyltransferase involved in cell wall biosynthesis
VSVDLGVLIITRNEEANIERCVSSVRFARDVVVVDSESTDATVEKARALGARVIVQPWLGYSAQKQVALDALETEWVLWVDADEEVSDALRADIERTLARSPSVAAYRVPRMVYYLGRWVRHGGWYPDPKLRLFRRSLTRFDGRLVHEGVTVEGDVGALHGPLYHYPYRDVEHHAEKVEQYARLGAEQLLREGRTPRWADRHLRPPARFVRMWILKAGFLDGAAGWHAARMGARYVRRKYRYAHEREVS